MTTSPGNGSRDAGTGAAAETSESAAYNLAERKAQNDDLADAVSGLSAYVDAHPTVARAVVLLADLYLRQGMRDAAERTYEIALQSDPGSLEIHDRLGTLLVAANRISDAIHQFDLALPYSRAYEHLVDVHRRIGDLRAYEIDFQDAVQQKPFDSDALWTLGLIYVAEHRPKDAIPYLKRASELERNACAILSKLADAYIQTRDFEGAVGALQRCLSSYPNDYNALVDLSSADIDRGGHISDALALLKKAQTEYPERPEAYVNFGYIEDEADRWQNAIDLYLKALALDPLERDAYVNLGYDYLLHGFYQKAEKTLTDGLAIALDDGRMHYFLALTFQRQGESAQAQGEFKKAMQSEEPEVAHAAALSLSKL